MLETTLLCSKVILGVLNIVMKTKENVSANQRALPLSRNGEKKVKNIQSEINGVRSLMRAIFPEI